ncbi:MAG: hypothetical protein ACP5VS_05205, partial [Desulfomonilaceae bacterium]
RRPDLDNLKLAPGWTKIHSWVFLVIIALGFLIIGVQNRYHYLSPIGLGKAYRIDKLFGGIQEFDPERGWVVAQLQSVSPPAPMSMLEPSSSGPQVPEVAPTKTPEDSSSTIEKQSDEPSVNVLLPKEETNTSPQSKESAPSSVVSTPVSPSAIKTPVIELSSEEKYKIFHQMFPDFGEDEFQLANDDLFPDWQKKYAPNGTWNEFLVTYKDFIRWWNDAGNPAETGVKLWQEFLAARGRS